MEWGLPRAFLTGISKNLASPPQIDDLGQCWRRPRHHTTDHKVDPSLSALAAGSPIRQTRTTILAEPIRELFDRVCQAAPKWWQTVLLLLVWVLSIGVGRIALAVVLGAFHR